MSETVIQNPFAPPRAEFVDAPTAPTQVELAVRGARLGASLIDAAPFIVFAILAAWGGSHGGGVFLLALGGLGMIAWVVYNCVLLYGHGQSVGKRVLGLRIVRTDGSRLSFKRFVFLREVPMIVLGLIPFLGRVIHLVDVLMIFRESRQCLHDVFADTLVVTAASSPHATLAGSNGGLPDLRF
jgi:uncharacterized RDD family membrane protein YckC